MKYSTVAQYAQAWCYVDSDQTPMPQWCIDALVNGDLIVEKEFVHNKMIKCLTIPDTKEPLNGVYEIAEGNFDYVVRLWDGEIVLMKSREFTKFFQPVFGEV